ncbi:hypothetical protein HYALB_00001653 [Hymenoscyphus albidus]|uniref:AB hydrolase-1 domain-containing protein n=1 Tax=Hymenoscyphus albidus TaxID=595503 RepID=A0A9N9PXZ5_9HELO|nr:hypothetical protein HYALB_00001653 [Hymenoscyphus albidus]
MDSKPPPIPTRHKGHGRRKSLQGPSTLPNRIHIQPASPEVISSLITSLSIISSPANQLFENPGGQQSTAVSPAPTSRTFGGHDENRSVGGSFGIDYGAYNQPSLRQLVQQESLDELAASPPVIRTAKPPSGFSPLTAPQSPRSSRDPSPLKTFLRVSSRPSSKGSTGSRERDDASSLGGISVEPGKAPPPVPELRRKPSSDSWGKKQSRQRKGLMYMSSKERLRDKEIDRQKGSSGTARDPNIDNHLPIPSFDPDTFMVGTAIGEEPEEFPTKPARTSPIGDIFGPNIASSVSQGGIGSGRFIPPRDSSLHKPAAAGKKRSSQRSSRQSSKHRGTEDGPERSIRTAEYYHHKRERSRRDTQFSPTEGNSKMMEPLEDFDNSQMARASARASKQAAENTNEDDVDEGAPSPSVAQRRSRESPERSEKKGGKGLPETLDVPHPKRSSSRLKRLSAPLSPKEKESSSSSSNQKKRVSSPDPVKPTPLHAEDRPNSADSIDDAVEAYLCSPRLSQKIRHPQTGRTISFSEVGDSEGFAVFCCVGMGLTRYITAFYDELALTLKLRLITPDRPGVGDSEPYTDGTATPLSWPDDVYAICQALKITKFSILAHSAGAIYALATALRMPQHIRGRIHLLAPWIPPSQLSVLSGQASSPPSNSIPTSQRILRALPTPILKAANSSFMSATSSSITSSLPKTPRRGKRKSTPARDSHLATGRRTVTPGPEKNEKDVHGRNSTVYPDPSTPSPLEQASNDPNDPNNEAALLAAAAISLADKERQVTYDTRLTHAIWELATSGANPAVDLLVCLERRHTIGFRYVDITRAVVIHHGSKDTRVPVENVRWLGKTMKKCEVRVLEGEGHGLMASAAVMGGVLMEIAREWEDWVKITGVGSPKTEGMRRTLRERASVGAFR